MAEDPKPLEIPEPTDDDLRRIAHADTLARFNDPEVKAALRREWYDRHQADAAHAFDGRFKEIPPDVLKDLELQDNRGLLLWRLNAVFRKRFYGLFHISSEQRTQESSRYALSNEQAEIQRHKNKQPPQADKPNHALKVSERLFESPEARKAFAEMWRQSQNSKPKVIHSSPFWAVLGFLRKWIALGGVFLIGAALTMIQIDEFALAGILLLIGMFAFSVQVYDSSGIEEHRSATRVLKGLAAVLIFGTSVFFGAVILKKKGEKPWSNLLAKETRPEVTNASLPSPTPSPLPALSEPKTAYEYFRSDDFDLMTMRNTGSVGVKKETMIVERRLIVDLNGKSEFLAFYIPPDRTYDVCLALLDQYPQVIKFFHQNIALQAGTLGSRATDLNELAFTGRIFLYYDGLIFQSKMDLLLSKAARKGVSLQFRGPDYVTIRNGGVPAPDKGTPPLVPSPNIDITLPKPGSRGTGP